MRRRRIRWQTVARRARVRERLVLSKIPLRRRRRTGCRSPRRGVRWRRRRRRWRQFPSIPRHRWRRRSPPPSPVRRPQRRRWIRWRRLCLLIRRRRGCPVVRRLRWRWRGWRRLCPLARRPRRRLPWGRRRWRRRRAFAPVRGIRWRWGLGWIRRWKRFRRRHWCSPIRGIGRSHRECGRRRGQWFQRGRQRRCSAGQSPVAPARTDSPPAKRPAHARPMAASASARATQQMAPRPPKPPVYPKPTNPVSNRSATPSVAELTMPAPPPARSPVINPSASTRPPTPAGAQGVEAAYAHKAEECTAVTQSDDSGEGEGGAEFSRLCDPAGGGLQQDRTRRHPQDQGK
uniref:Uncharacterized protein n=1 Tax=Oryza punctata TaxID=4537 RepID=A0A0E0MNL4_ORYPU